ncbi:TPA: hypothetical protein N0F65_000677 [Lagenidium giganteum]|uniref:Uncharacterized protein n=1 Tax=Lagenidium giganteum TaxID=4803 RepID=A0AAV2YX37_9STRA|nr:TPA: hypothetical protein N0F65_000677 [Lagenidium giganteum]
MDFLPWREVHSKDCLRSDHTGSAAGYKTFAWDERTRLQNEVLDGLPGEVFIVAAEVAVRGGLAHDWALELQVTLEDTGAQVKVLLNDLHEVIVGEAVLHGAVRVNVDAKWVWHTNSVRKLHEGTRSEALGNDRLSDPTRGVSGRTVHLGGVLAREGTTTVGAPATIGVDDDLTASEAGITVWATNDEAARWVQVVHGLVVEVLLWDNGLNDVLHEVSSDLLVADFIVVLGRDDDSVHALWHHAAIFFLVLDGDLGLAIRADPVESAVLAHFSQTRAQLGGEDVRERHELLGLVGGIAEHDALVTGADILFSLRVNRLGDIWRLLLNGNNDVDGLVVEALGWVIVADVLDGVADDLFVVDDGLGGDFTENHDHAGLGARLAGNARVWILGNAGIEHGIRDLIAELVWMALVHGLGREQEGAAGLRFGLLRHSDCVGRTGLLAVNSKVTNPAFTTHVVAHRATASWRGWAVDRLLAACAVDRRSEIRGMHGAAQNLKTSNVPGFEWPETLLA